MKVYNSLEGEARAWASDNKFSRGEYAIRVKGGKKVSSNAEVARVAGDGRFGFNSRKVCMDPVRMICGMDGQYIKKRKSVARPRKNISRLWMKKDLTRDIMLELEREKQESRIHRRRNRNKVARKGRNKCLING